MSSGSTTPSTSFPFEPSWSPVGPHGAQVRVLQRGPGVEARLVFTAADGNGYDEEPLGFGLFDANGEPAEDRLKAAKREAAKFSNLRLSGEVEHATSSSAPLTLGEAADAFREDQADGPPSMSKGRGRVVRRRLEALEGFFGRDFVLRDLARSDWNRYHDRRRRGIIDARGRKVPEGNRSPVSKDTASKDLQVLRQLCRWATGVRGPDGDFLLDADPTRGLDLEWNEDPRQPTVTDELLAGLREEATKVRVELKQGTKDEPPVTAPTPLPVIVVEVANGTGRRINSILGLRWGDWDPDRRFEGWDVPGALTWRAEFDKNDRTMTVPVLPEVRRALTAWRSEQPDIVPPDAWIFPAPTEPEKRLDANVARDWLQEAERAARERHVRRFGWHSFRRRWVNRVARRLPPAVAAAMGGWKDAHVMQTVYERLPNPDGVAAELGRALGREDEAREAAGDAGGG